MKIQEKLLENTNQNEGKSTSSKTHSKKDNNTIIGTSENRIIFIKVSRNNKRSDYTNILDLVTSRIKKSLEK